MLNCNLKDAPGLKLGRIRYYAEYGILNYIFDEKRFFLFQTSTAGDYIRCDYFIVTHCFIDCGVI